MEYLLVLQWAGSSSTDFEELVKMEDALEEALGDYASVDGHDLGSGEMNIFIATEHPNRAFEDARTILDGWLLWGAVRAAYRHVRGASYTLLWPPELRSFKVS
jgi:dihydroxyacetone kinase DhaKLM complex PTS-EIIA-like component DhaM